MFCIKSISNSPYYNVEITYTTDKYYGFGVKLSNKEIENLLNIAKKDANG